MACAKLWVITAAICGIVTGLLGCERPAPIAKPPVPPPTGLIVLSQHLEFADGSETFQGTGFLAKTPSGAIVGVTSAHFLDQDGPPLRRFTMWTTRDNEKGIRNVLTATRSLGQPGDEGILTRTEVDLSNDRLILLPESPIDANDAGAAVMSLDRRRVIPTGERVWFPYRGLLRSKGQELVEGRVTASDTGGSVVELDRELPLTSESGSPVISQATGLVIGTLSRGGGVDGKTTLIIAPSHAILKAMREAEAVKSSPLLGETIGKKR